MATESNNSTYWDEVANTWQQTARQRVLRSISDTLNSRFLERWLPQRNIDCLLKTDLFDESLTDGLSTVLVSRAEKTVGIDSSFAIVSGAKRNCHGVLNVTAADVRHVPFATGTFDVIVSNSTLDHFEKREDITESLQELYRVLRPGGQLLITLDNPTNPLVGFRNLLPFGFLNRTGIVPYRVGATLNARRLKRTLEDVGFSGLEVTALWHFPRIIAADLLNLMDWLFGGRLTPGLLKCILGFECLSRCPTRYLTGHFVAARGTKRV